MFSTFALLASTTALLVSAAVVPGGSFLRIHPNGDPTKCLDLQGGVLEKGTPVQIYDCNESGGQRWTLIGGSTTVSVSATNFCLDAGSNPASGVGMKIWTCFPGIPAQNWFYTADNRIALEGKGQCLDLTNGDLTNGNQVQTWQCTDNNLNQVWTIGGTDGELLFTTTK